MAAQIVDVDAAQIVNGDAQIINVKPTKKHPEEFTLYNCSYVSAATYVMEQFTNKNQVIHHDKQMMDHCTREGKFCKSSDEKCTKQRMDVFWYPFVCQSSEGNGDAVTRYKKSSMREHFSFHATTSRR